MAGTFTNATSEYLETAFSGVTGVPLSVSLWAQAVDVEIEYTMWFLGDKDSHADWFRLYTRDGVGNVRFQKRDGSGLSHAESGGMTNGTWHQVGAVSSAADSYFAYTDGSPSDEQTTSRTPANVDRISIGRLGDASPEQYWDGLIAEVAVWNVALTTAEMAILADGYAAPFVRPDALVFYAPLISVTGDEPDLVGGLILTNNNTVTDANHPRIIYPTRPHIITAPAAAAPAGTEGPLVGGKLVRHSILQGTLVR